MSREFEVRREVELPASPEDVWEAVATASGNAAWLFPVGEIEGRVGATNADGSTVTAWDAPHHFAVRTEGEGGWFNAIEFTLEAREGGTTLVRYAHSGIFVDDWDNQYDAVNQHTDFYLHTLGQYLQHFNGRRATFVGDVPGGIMAPAASAEADGFTRLREALGVGSEAAEGDSVQVASQGLDGVVDYTSPNFLGVRTADGLYRFFGRNAFGMPVGMVVHLFTDGADADADATKQQWQDWLNGVYA
ncbi:MAG: hypothetical protein V7607_2335 [Solirubrobacteraceae bacterium]